MRQVTLQHQGDLRLGLRLHEPAPGNFLSIADGHLGEQRSEIGGVDSQLRLHGQRCQANLAAY